eukprot:Amastigsp_a676357_11.p2 type:complete len:214 gc:universal Amastigsp_a676357_11:666-25(-)
MVDRNATNEHGPPEQNLAKVVGMPRDGPQPCVAELAFVLGVVPEVKLLLVSHGLADEADEEKHPAHNVHPRVRGQVPIVRARNKHGGKRHGEHPHSLEDPKRKERAKVLAPIVESLVRTDLENAEQEIACQTKPPHRRQYQNHDVPGCVLLVNEEKNPLQQHEIGSARKVSDFVELAAVRDNEKRGLLPNRDQETKEQIERINRNHLSRVRHD